MEPRLLLSADGLSAGVSATHQPVRTSIDLQAINVSDTTNWGNLPQSSTADVAGAKGSDLFADVADEALFPTPAAVVSASNTTSTKVNETTTPAVVEAVPETVSAAISLAVSASYGTENTAASTLGATSLTGQSDTLSDQLTTTLTAANGPPAISQTLSGQYSDTSLASYDFTDSLVRARAAASVSSSLSDSKIDISPARAAAITPYTGDHEFAQSGTTTINISGSASGQFDQVTVTGAAKLGGILRINLTGTPTLQVGDRLDILTFGSSSGDFLKYENLAIGNNLYFKPTIANNKLTLTVATTVGSSIQQPLFFIPGFGGTFAADESPAGLQEYYLTKGVHPDKLALEPLANSFSDIIQSFVNLGYTLDLNLFAVKWDWRVPVALTDGVTDGSLSATVANITNTTFESGLDYLGYYLGQAGQIWQTLTNTALTAVDIVTHSTGGLISRAYIQSTAYPANPATPVAGELPAVRNLVQVGVPNEGASTTFEMLQNDFSLRSATRLMGRVLDATYDLISEKDSGGNYIRGILNPDGTTTRKTTFDAMSNPQVGFVAYYIGAFSSLLPTYDGVISTDGGTIFTALTTATGGMQNDLLLDLNYDSNRTDTNIEADRFVDRVIGKVTIVYGSGVNTEDQILKKTGSDLALGFQNEVLTFDSYIGHLPASGEVWYLDVKSASSQGDGTVPARSSSALFASDTTRQGAGKLQLVNIGVTTTSGGSPVEHTSLVWDIDSQKAVVLAATGVTATTGQISQAKLMSQAASALKLLNLGVFNLRDFSAEISQRIKGLFEDLAGSGENELQMAVGFVRQSVTNLLPSLNYSANFSIPSLSTDISISITAGATAGTLGKLLIGATGASAFSGTNGMGVRFSNGQLGLAIYGNGTYAVDASGSAAVTGVPELVLEGTLHVRRNTAGPAVNESIVIPLAGGGSRTVTLAFTQNEVLRMSGSLGVVISQFVYLRGNITFDIGATLTVPLEDNTTTQVLALTIGASNVNVFFGTGGPYWVDSDNNGVIDSADIPSSRASGLVCTTERKCGPGALHRKDPAPSRQIPGPES